MPRRLPRNVQSADLAKRLRRALGYEISRQEGSHVRMATMRDGWHPVTLPLGKLRIGTFNAILADIARHHRLSRDELLKLLGF